MSMFERNNSVIQGLTGILLGFCWFFSFALAAQDLPEWLRQAAENKHRAPNASLVLLQENETQFALLSPEQQATWLNIQATVLSHLGRYPEQQVAAQRGLDLVMNQPGALQIELMLELGYAAEMQLALTEAISWYQRALQQAQALNHPKLRLKATINLAAVDLLQERDKVALEALQHAYQEIQQLQDVELLAEINAQLGLMYSTLLFAEEATGFLEQALTLYRQLEWPKHQVTILYNLARNYSFLQDFTAALQHYDLMLQAARQEQDLAGMYHAYSGMGITNNEMGRPQVAINYMQKAEEFLPVIQADYYRAGHHFEKALIYQKLQQTSLALQQLQLAEEYLINLQQDEERHKLLSLLYLKTELLAEQGQYERAYLQLKEFVKGFQQARDKENELAIEKIRLNFEAERDAASRHLREQELQVQTLRLAEKQHNQILYWLLFMVLALVGLLILFGWMLFSTRKRLAAVKRVTHHQSQDKP